MLSAGRTIAEVDKDLGIEDGSDNDARSYSTYSKTRPTSWKHVNYLSWIDP